MPSLKHGCVVLVAGFAVLASFTPSLSWAGDVSSIPRSNVTAHDAHTLPEGALSRLGSLAFRHGGDLRQIGYTADGALLVSFDKDDRIRVWDVTTGRLRRQIVLECSHFATAAF